MSDWAVVSVEGAVQNPCTTAAYSRIPEIVAKADGKPPPILDKTPFIPWLPNEDMKAAM